MVTCPAGHSSAATDFCDVCGAPLTGGPPGPGGAGPPGVAGVPTEQLPQPTEVAEPAGGRCPDCGAARTGRFCEECGYDYSTRTSGKGIPGLPMPSGPPSVSRPTPPDGTPGDVPAGSWAAVVTADRDYHASVLAQLGPDTPPVPFPPYHPTRQVLLTGQQVRIGRRSVSRGVTPEIDLGERPEDPGVSHIHAVLLARPDGSWVLVDPGSTNGTTVNDGTDPIAYNIEVPLHDGDRIHVGAWTTITLLRGPRGGGADAGEGGGAR